MGTDCRSLAVISGRLGGTTTGLSGRGSIFKRWFGCFGQKSFWDKWKDLLSE